jgi:hypothetical protein
VIVDWMEDTGKSDSDRITNDTFLMLTGTAEADSCVDVYAGATKVGSTTADASGNWSLNVPGPLADATYSFTATATDIAGNTSDPSVPPLVIQVDATAPNAPVISGIVDDTGKSISDGITNDTSLIIVGTTEPGACVTVYDDGIELGTATADGSGDWSYPESGTLTVANGETHRFSATAMDVAGNTGPESPEFVVVIDTDAPAQPVVAGVMDDTGTSNTDGFTRDTSLIVFGTAEPGTCVTVYDGGVALGTTTANASGDWMFPESGTLPGADGETHPYTAIATDTAGNDSPESDPFVAVIDLTAPNVLSFKRQDPMTSPTDADVLVFRVTFDEGVIADAADFVVTGTTATIEAPIMAVDGSNKTQYDVKISGGDLPNLDGTVCLDFSMTATIEDLAGNAFVVVEPPIDEWYVIQNYDYGDAPGPYPTLLADGGARHLGVGPMLGGTRDLEADGVPSLDAQGDDTTGMPDDEDGVTFVAIQVGQVDATLNVDVQNWSADTQLDVWVDWNQDGNWGGPNEQIVNSLPVSGGNNTITFDVPGWATPGDTYARFRLSTADNVGIAGTAPDGEIEDYLVTVLPPALAGEVFLGPNIVSSNNNDILGLDSADIDGDGDIDLVGASRLDNKIAWYENDGTGQFSEHIVGSLDDVIGVVAADLDGDLDIDIVVSAVDGNQTSVYLNDGSQSFSKTVLASGNGRAQQMVVADVDGDGHLDIVTATRDAGVEWLQNDGMLGFTRHTVTGGTGVVHDVQAIDVDQDGDLDFVFGRRTTVSNGPPSGLFWAENDGAQSFTTHQIDAFPCDALPFQTVGDFNGNGSPDIAQVLPTTGEVRIYDNDGSGSFSPRTLTETLVSPRTVTSGDLDGDGDLDLVVSELTTDNVAWLINDGTGDFTQVAIGQAAAFNGTRLLLADLDGDSDLDIAGSFRDSDSIVWFGNSKLVPPPTPISGPIEIHGSDGDDILELFVTDADSGMLYYTRDLDGPSESMVGPIDFDGLTKLTFNGLRGDDRLIIHNPMGSLFDPVDGFVFNGGDGGEGNGIGNPDGDALWIFDGIATTVEHRFVNDSDGFIFYNGEGTPTVTYTGLEPIIDTITAANRIFTYNGGAETIVLQDDGDVGDGETLIDSTLGEEVLFANPTSTLTINAGSGDDSIELAGLDSSFDADLTVNGGDGSNDAVSITENNDVGSGVVRIGTNDDVESIMFDGGSLTTTTDVILTSLGAISDNGGSTTDITATQAALRAGTGIGDDSDAIETAADATAMSLTVAAQTESGDIAIRNDGHLVVATVDALPGITILDMAAGGDDSGTDNITVTALGSLTVDTAVANNDGGNIDLTAAVSGAVTGVGAGLPAGIPLGDDIDGEAAEDQSGYSVSLSADGSTVAIGALSNDGNGNNAGHVRVYKLSGGVWTQVGSDIDGKAASDQSGISVSLSADGNTVAIGADGNGVTSGRVSVYQFNGSAWTQVGTDINGEAAGDQSGSSVSLSADGSTVAIGAFDNDGTGISAGHVRIYEFNGSAWTQLGSDIDGEGAGDQSGWSVSLSADGRTVAIGANGNNGAGTTAGHVRVYEFNGSAWTQLGSDIDGEAAGDESGWSVALSADGSTVAIGSRGNIGTNGNAGHVRVYQFSGGVWTQIGSDIDGEAPNDESGYSVSLSADGSIIAIGAIGNDESGDDAGHVRVYEFTGGAWTQVGSDIDGEAAEDHSGWSVSLSEDGSTVAIGAIGNNATGTTAAGHVRVIATGTASGGVVENDVALNANVTVTGGDSVVDGDGNITVNAAGNITQASTSIVSADGGGLVNYSAGSLGQTSGHPNLVASYDFNGDIADSSGNGRDATAIGGELAVDRFGQANSAYRFDGVDDYLMASNMGLPDGNASRTMTAWMKLDSYGSSPGHSPVLFAYGSNAAGQQSGVRLANEHWQFSFWEPAFDLNVATNPPLGEWVHVAMVYDQATSTARIYQNGVDVGSRTVVPNTMLSANGLTIGRNTEIQGAQFYYLPGTLDDVQIYDAALTPAELAMLATTLPVGTGGSITMADGAQAISQTGTISLLTDGNITLGRLSTGNDTSSAVSVTSTAGDVIDGGDSDGEDIAANSAGAVVTVSAATGIGDEAQAGGAADRAIETAVDILNATVTGSGGIDLNETDAAELRDVSTADGFIRVDADGTLTTTLVDSSDTDDGSNDVILTTSAGDILVTLIDAGGASGGNDVVLKAAGQINETAGTVSTVNVIADGVRLQTNGGDVGAEVPMAYAGTTDASNLFDLTAHSLEANVAGGLYVQNSQALTLVDNDLTAAIDGMDDDDDDGATAITTSGMGDVRVNAAGNVTVSELVSAAMQLVSIDSAGGIRSNSDMNGSGDADIMSGSVALRSDNGIGVLGDHLELATSTLAFLNDTAGSVFIDNLQSGLTIGDVDEITQASGGSQNSVSGGATRVVTRGPLTVSHDVTTIGMATLIARDQSGPTAMDNLTVNGNVTVESTMSSVLLAGGDNVSLLDASTVRSSNSSVQIRVDYADPSGSPDPDLIDADSGVGGVVQLLGTIDAGSPSHVLGDADDDQIIVLPDSDDGSADTDFTTELVIDLGEGSDRYGIHMGARDAAGGVIAGGGINGADDATNADVTISDTGLAGTDAAFVWATSGNDTIDVHNLAASETVAAIGGEINNYSINGVDGTQAGTGTNERIVYTQTLERLSVDGGRNNSETPGILDDDDIRDVVNANPSQSTLISLNGNNRQFGTGPNDVPQVPGDLLNLQTFGNRFAMIGKAIQTQQGLAADGYELLSFRNFEEMPLDDPANDAPIGTEYLKFDINVLDAQNNSSPTQDHPAVTGVTFVDLDPNDAGFDRSQLMSSTTQADYIGVVPTDFYGRDLDGAGPLTDTATYGWVVDDPDDATQGPQVAQSDLGAGSFGGDAYEDLKRDTNFLGGRDTRTFRTDLADGWYLVTVQAGEAINMRVRDAFSGDVVSDLANIGDAGVFSFVVLVRNTDGSGVLADDSNDANDGLQLQFESVGQAGRWSVAGIDIRPAEILTFGSPEPGALAADGATIDISNDTFNTTGTVDPEMDFFGIFDATPGAIITVSARMDVDGDEIPDIDLTVFGYPSDGIDAALDPMIDVDNPVTDSVDVDPFSDGIQVMADANGVARFGIQRPTTIGSAFVSFQEFDGSQTGCLQIDYVAPNVRRFDFNNGNEQAASSPTQGPINQDVDVSHDPAVGTAGGYIGVLVGDRFSNPELGYGWSDNGSNSPFDNGGSGIMPLPERENLLRDGHRRADAPSPVTFSTYLDSTGTYEVNLFAQVPQGVSISIEGVPQSFTPSDDIQQLTFRNITVADGIFDLTFGGSSAWRIYGLEIIDQAELNIVTIDSVIEDPSGTPVTHLPADFPVELDADGSTEDTINGNSSVADSYVTISTTLGTITSADALANVAGLQVATDASGNFSFDLRRPGGPGTPLITVQTIDGTGSLPLGTGNSIISYVGQDLGTTALLFDFDSSRDIQTEPGYTSVPSRFIYDVDTGFGWTGSNAGRDLNSIRMLPGVEHAQLLRDTQGYVAPRTFRADVAGGATYIVTATIRVGRNVTITDAVTGAPLVTGLDASDGTITSTFNYTATGENGVQLEFSGTGRGGPQWRISGLTIRAAQSTITVDPPVPPGPRPSDGATASIWSVSGLMPNHVYTITPDGGTLGTIVLGGGDMSADFHPIYAGAQIVADNSGTATFELVAPAAPGDVTVSVDDVTGAATGAATQTYAIPSVWLFDFNGPRDATIAAPELVGTPTVTGVTQHETTATTGGYGWSRVFGRGAFDSGEVAGVTALREDGVYLNNASTFQVITGSTGTFDVRIYTTQGRNPPAGLEVFVEGVSQGTTMLTNAAQTLTFNNGGAGFSAGADGILDVEMVRTTRFGPAFISGIEISTNGIVPAPGAQTLDAVSIGSGAAGITQSELDAGVAGALDRIAASGASQATLDTLAGVTVTIADLSGTRLGITQPAENSIQIDLDAAGHGWFVDDTPLDDSEFGLTLSPTGLTASQSSPATRKVDLLTTLLHEFAHVLGYEHEDAGLLNKSLETGTRHVDDIFSDEALFNSLD